MRIILLTILSFVFLFSKGQDFSGIRSSRYAGVNGVFTNPANIAGSGYRFDVNLFSLSAVVANDQSSFGFSDLKNIGNGDTLLNRFFPRNSSRSSSMASVNVVGPSVLINLNRKSAFALTTRARVVANAMDIDNKLARQLISDLDEGGITYPYTIASANRMIATTNGWTEFGASYAQTLLEKGNHVLKAGVTLKYLAGSANAYFSLGNLNATVNRDLLLEPYLTNSTGNVNLGFGGVNIADFNAGDLLDFKGRGFGGDIGITYEWRQNETPDDNDYVLKAGLSLTDIGSIRYDRDQTRSGAFAMSIPANQRFYLNEISGSSIEDVKATFRRYPQYFTENTGANTANYTVALPGMVQLYADYHFQKNLYLNAAAQFATTTSDNGYNSRYYNQFSATPRFETRSFSVYAPLAYNSLSKFVAGFGLRAGPLFVGSGSLFSALFNSSKQVDVQVGLRFYGLSRK